MTDSNERGDWAGLPFPEEEYVDRIARLSDEMAKRGIDVLCVTDPANLNYLTGYASVWYSKRIPTIAALSRENEKLVFYDYIRHKDLAGTARADEIVVYGEEHYTAESGVAAIVQDFRARGWTQGTVGLEDWSLFPVLGLREQIQAGLEQAGAKLADASWMVDHLRLFKSPREIVYVRRAAEIVNEAIEEIPAYIKEGVTEVELAARLNLLLAERGGEEPALPLMVDSGYKASHALPTRRPFQTGDVISLNPAGVFNHYHVDCLREFSLGPNDRSQEIMSVTAGTLATTVVVSATDGLVRAFSGGQLVLQMDPDVPFGPIQSTSR